MASISQINTTNSLYNAARPDAANAAKASTTTAPAAKTQTATTGQEDSVQISAAARANKTNYKESQSVANLAAVLGVTTQVATSDDEVQVQLSAATRAKLLHKEGLSVSNIAAAFGATTETVDSYLGITVTSAIDQALQAAEAAATAKA
jgi:hypothetical protein